METVLLSIGLLAVFFIFMSVRLLLLKNGEFKGTCASQSPFLKNEVGNCSYCGKPVGACETENEEDKDNTTEVEKVMDKFN